jgi:hypothetical protein
MGVTWHEADHSCPFTVVLRLSVWSWTSISLNTCMACRGTTLEIPDCTENTEFDSCLKSGFYILIVEFSLHLLFLDTNDCFFFLELFAASFCGFVWTPTFNATQLELFGWCTDGAFDPLQQQKGRQCHIFSSFFPSYIQQKPESFSCVTSWNTVPEEREKVCTIFICLFFWGFTSLLLVYLACYECSKCLYRRYTKFELFYFIFV